MPHDEHPNLHDEPTPALHDAPAHDTAVQAPHAPVYEPLEEPDDWLEEYPESELPRRPRRRLLAPVPLALLGVLLIACGFIAGALVEKGQSSSASTGASGGAASRFAALRSGAASATSTGRGGPGAAGGGAAGGGAAGGGAFAGGAGRAGGAGATVGQVAYVSGHTLYVTDFEGNTVKVTTSEASTISKTVKADVKSIHPGETVVVSGSPGANGAISAESIRVGEASGGGLGALFGAGGTGSRGAGSRGGGASGAGGGTGGGSGEPALFGG